MTQYIKWAGQVLEATCIGFDPECGETIYAFTDIAESGKPVRIYQAASACRFVEIREQESVA
jgi:hypothetical protein